MIDGVVVRKFGICNTRSSRLAIHETRGWKIIDISPPNQGHVVRDMERDIYQALGHIGIRQRGFTGRFDGYTETYRPDLLEVDASTFETLHAEVTTLIRKLGSP
jgi:hypothetical protein